MSPPEGAGVSTRRGAWRLLLGVAAVMLFGVPIMRVLSWIVGGFWGFVVLVILGAGAILILGSS